MSAYNSTPAFAIGGVQPANQWRSVKDEMPGFYDPVIVMGMSSTDDEPRPQEGYRHSDEWSTTSGDLLWDVTHWMPMPAAPGKEAQ